MGKVVETIYGKYSKYEIIKTEGGLLSSTFFTIYRDGRYHRGTFSSLAAAVEAARRDG